MIGQDAIGFHAIGEMIIAATPPIEYLTPSRPTGAAMTSYYRRGEATQTTQPTVITTTVQNITWDDDTNILWDDDTIIEWDA